MEKLIRIKQLTKIFGVSRQTIFKWRKSGKFPKPFKKIGQTSFWLESQFKDGVVPSQSVQTTDGEALYV